MNLEEYEKNTGTTVADNKKSLVSAKLRKARRTLENLLGYTLDRNKITQNIYNETGKAPNGSTCPDVDTSNLLPADEVIGAYRLYSYNEDDQYFHVDPFTAVHAVKLVFIRKGYPEEESITLKTFDADDIRVHFGNGGIGKYIEKRKPYYWLCGNDYLNMVQLAVDADWAFQDCLTPDLQDIIVDIVQEELDPKNDIQSESIEGHSYSKKSKILSATDEPLNIAIMERYEGPGGSLTRKSITL